VHSNFDSNLPDGVTLGDFPEMDNTLESAEEKAHRVFSVAAMRTAMSLVSTALQVVETACEADDLLTDDLTAANVQKALEMVSGKLRVLAQWRDEQ